MISNAMNAREYRGLSTDMKPVENVSNGSIFLELDTLAVYLFDEENKVWVKAD